MSAADLLSTAYFGPQAQYVPTDFGDVFADTFEDTLRGRQPTGYFVSVAEEGRAFSERNDLIRERFGRDIVAEVKQENPEAGADFLVKEYQARTDKLIEEGRAKDAEKWQGIRTAAEIEAGTVDRAQVARIESERTAARAEDNMARYGGGIAGGVAASFLDPINLATLPLGAGAGVGILRGALLDGALNMGIEAAEAPFNAQWQKELGFKYGLGEAAADIVTAGAGGTVLSGMIRGGGKVLGKLTGHSERILRDIADNPAHGSEVRAAASYMERVAHLDENIPTPRVADDVSVFEINAAHRANAQEMQDAFRNRREPVFSDDIPFDVTPEMVTRQAPPAREFSEGTATGNKFENYTRPRTDEVRSMEGLVEELQTAERGSVMMVERDGQGSTQDVVTATTNTFPDWFRQLNREGESISREYVGKVVQKIKEAKPLGKKEVRIAKALFDEVRARREENVRQIQNFREARAADRAAESQASIDAMAAREAAREMADPYLQPMPDAAARMAEDVKAGAETEMMDAAQADFDRLLTENPEMTMVMEDGRTMSVAEIAAEMDDDLAILQAVTVCGVRG